MLRVHPLYSLGAADKRVGKIRSQIRRDSIDRGHDQLQVGVIDLQLCGTSRLGEVPQYPQGTVILGQTLNRFSRDKTRWKPFGVVTRIWAELFSLGDAGPGLHKL